MGFLNWFTPRRKEVSRQQRISQAIRASFDAASNDAQLDKLFAEATNENAFASPGLRDKLRTRVRYEVTNNPYLRGMLKGQANDIVGRGPSVQFDDDNQEIVNQAEIDFQQWANDIEFAEKLRLLVECWKRDGEALAILTEWDNSPNAVKVDLVVLEIEMLTGGTVFHPEFTDFKDGIRTDDFGRPLEYLICTKNPDEGFLQPGDYRRMPASDVIHLYTKDRPSQRRGITAYVASLLSAALLRAYSMAVVKAATIASAISFVVHTNEVGEDSEACQPFDVIDIEAGAGITLPDGYNITQFQARQPTDTYDNFKEALVTEIGRPLSLPKHKSTGSSSDYNYASVRLDDQQSERQTDIDRQSIEFKICRKVLRHWLSEYVVLRPEVLQLDSGLSDMPSHSYAWDGKPHVDPLKEVNADVESLKYGVQGLHDLYTKRNKDPRRELTKAAKALGMTYDEYVKGVQENIFESQNKQPPTTQPPETDKGKGKGK